MLPEDMETVNALELRRSLGKVLDQLERSGEPISGVPSANPHRGPG